MSRLAVLVTLLAGCGFRVSGQAQGDGAVGPDTGGDASGDASTDASIDAPIDASIDAPIPVTTDHASVADTFIAADVANTNFSGQTSMLADGGPNRNALVRFDLSTLPANTTITSVALHIWTDDDNGANVDVYQVLESWTEADATWSSRTTNTAWATAGAEPPSRATTSLGTIAPAATFTAYVVPLDTSVVTAWVAAPASNFGVMLRTTDGDGSRFATKEHATAARHPFLRITHAP